MSRLRSCLKAGLKILIVSVTLSACASKSEKKAAVEDPKETQKQASFNEGVRALDQQDYEEAARIFDHLLLQRPGSNLDLLTIMNSGSAYEGMGECKKAADRFRQVVRSSAGKFRQAESEALFHLSLMYECLGEDTKAVTALLDARRHGQDLPPEEFKAILPARLAAAYARLGNRAQAMEAFSQANHGLKMLVAEGASRAQLNRLARTMFLMGHLSPAQRLGEVNPGTYLQSVSMQQPFLLQAMEMHIQPYAIKAEEDLKLCYETIFKLNPGEAHQRREFYTRGLQTSAELKKIRMTRDDPSMNSLYALVDQTELRLQNELNQVKETNPLTPEALQREGLKRQGKLIDPNRNQTER